MAIGCVNSIMACELNVIEDIYTYWMNKRLTLGKALMRKFQEQPSFDDPSPNVAFRPRERERRVSHRNVRCLTHFLSDS
jgi:hypothetical protein